MCQITNWEEIYDDLDIAQYVLQVRVLSEDL